MMCGGWKTFGGEPIEMGLTTSWRESQSELGGGLTRGLRHSKAGVSSGVSKGVRSLSPFGSRDSLLAESTA